jgi:hypothetical protein
MGDPDYELPEEIEIDGFDPDKFQEQYPTLKSLIKTTHGATKKISELSEGVKGTIRLPAEDADEESVSEFYSKLGRPDDTEGYEQIEGMAEEAAAKFNGAAFKAGLTSAQHKELATAIKGFEESQIEDAKESLKDMAEAFETERKARYGARYEEKMALIERTRNEVFLKRPDLAEGLKKTGLEDHAALDELLLMVADAIGDDKLAKHYDTLAEDRSLPDKAAAEKRMDEIMRDENFQPDKKGTREYDKLEEEFLRMARAVDRAERRSAPVHY